MNIRRRTAAAVAGIAAAAMILAGCSAGGGQTDPDTAPPVRIAGSDPENMIPGNSYAFYLQQLMFDTLTEINQDTGEVENLVAAEVASDDQTVWHVTLHDTWTFHDGTPVTAQSFADAWNATAYQPNAWGNNFYFANFVGYEDLNPADGGEPASDALSGVEVVSDTELTITLQRPDGLFPYTLANPALAPLPEVAFDDFDAYNTAPIGNGAFQIDGTYQPEAPYNLVAYEDYAGEAPTVQALEFVPYTDYSTAFNDLLAGNLDTVYPVPAQRLSEMEQNLDGQYERSTIPNLNYFSIPTWDDRFEDERVRQAISMAIDRDAIAESILQGAGEPAYSLAPESAVGGRTNICDACVYDPEAARALLDEAGGFDGQLVLHGSQYTFEDQILQAVANQLSQNLGIDATFSLNDDAWQLFKDQQLDGPALSYWGAYYPHVQGLVQPITTTYGLGNANGVSNETIDALVAEGDTLVGDEAIALYQQAEDIALDEMWNIPLYFGIYTAAWGDTLQSVPTGPNGYGDLGQIVLQ